MAKMEKKTIRLFCQKEDIASDAVMRFNQFSVQECKVRAIKKLVIFWLIAAICVLIPVAHLVLVPAFLIGGAVAAGRLWKRREEGVDASGACPVCHNAITIDLEKSAELPQWHTCPQCSESLELQQPD